MDVTIMPSTSSLLNKLKTDFPELTFSSSSAFSWSPTTKTVSYHLEEAHAGAFLLHELSHGILNHQEYKRDIELIAMETAAWEKAKALASTYAVPVHEDTVEDSLDTYREWLHSRSSCPECTATGFQTSKNTYECAACSHTWRVNEARLCALRRYTT